MITVRAPRLVLAERLARRDHLHGAWWPYSTDIQLELPPVLGRVAARFGPIRGVLLNREEWPQAPIAWQPDSSPKVRISWYGVQEAHTVVLLCAGLSRLMLLVLPPETPEYIAVSATLLACQPGNSQTSAQTLHRAAALGADSGMR